LAQFFPQKNSFIWWVSHIGFCFIAKKKKKTLISRHIIREFQN
jgi:hypothetical protein